MRVAALTFTILLAGIGLSTAQVNYNQSTGADGDLVLDYGSGSTWVQLPDSGILNYSSISIATFAQLRFKRNTQNTPVILLVQGDVTIQSSGAISVNPPGVNAHNDADYTIAGPGGYDGAKLAGKAGQGPGGGPASDSDNRARWVGPLTLIPPVGGSGGGAAAPGFDQGGGGGGAIVIAAGGKITIAGEVFADAANGQSRVGGSGGAIRLVASQISITGNLWARGAPGIQGQAGNNGMIRLEAPAGKVSFTSGAISPAPVVADLNQVVLASASPTLTITSIGGFPVPTTSGSRTDAADLVLPRQLTDPVNLVVAATNIPVGTPVAASFGAGTGSATPGTLAGTDAASTATVPISGMLRDGTITYIYVTATFTVPSGGRAYNPSGPDHVANVQMKTELGGGTTYAFLRDDGSEVPRDRLPREFLSLFGR